jgi:diguanylate cyclase (GGDEF)-like protein
VAQQVDTPIAVDSDMRRSSEGETPRAVVVVGSVAAVYFVLALGAQWLLYLPGLGTAMWPAAGVAFAAAAVFGWRALTGVAVGAFSANMVWLTTVDVAVSASLVSSAAVGIGAVLQAWVAVLLVRAVVGPRFGYDGPKSILLTLLLSGPIACVIGATSGVLAQLATGISGTAQLQAAWVTWWAGDSIGVILFAPLVLLLLPSQNDAWRGRRVSVAVSSVVFALISVAVLLQSVNFERERVESEIGRLATSAVGSLDKSVGRHEEVLVGLRGLFEASDQVDADEFQIYTDKFLDRFPSLQAVSWNPVVANADLADFIAQQQQQPGFADFTVTERTAEGELVPVAERDQHVVVAYIEPLAENSNALGFDIASNPARVEAIEGAATTGEAIGTAPIDLVQESGSQKGMLVLLPLYPNGMNPEKAVAKGVEPEGFTVGVYRLGDLVAETFEDSTWDDLAIQLVDVTDEEPVVVADLPARSGVDDERIVESLSPAVVPLNTFGRDFELSIQPTSGPLIDGYRGESLALFTALVILAFLLESLVLLLTGFAIRARRDAEELSYEATHDALTGLRNRRAFMREFERTIHRDPETETGPASDILLFCDLDGFKQVNDEGGHRAGDEVLRAVAADIGRHVRARDIVARMGGDEIAILLVACELADGQRIASNIVQSILDLRVETNAGVFSVGISAGLAQVQPESDSSVDEYLHRADLACYQAKRAGKGQTVVYGQGSATGMGSSSSFQI